MGFAMYIPADNDSNDVCKAGSSGDNGTVGQVVSQDEDASTVFSFGTYTHAHAISHSNSLFNKPAPNPFALKHVPGDVHTPYSAPLWFETDPGAVSGYRGKSLPPFWWGSRFPGKSVTEEPAATPAGEVHQGFRGHSILR